MAAIYDLNRPNPLAAPCDEESCKPPLVKILTSHEFSQLTHIAPEARAELAALELAAANFVELYPSYIIGSFSVPDKSDPTGDPDTMSFYLEADHLILIDDGDIAQKTLDKVAATGILTKPTTSHTLYAFMKTLIADDFSWFSSMEDAMESLEDAMIGHHADIPSQTLLEPLPFTPDASDADVLQQYGNVLAELGFTLEPFGRNDYILRGVPAQLDAADALPALEEICAQLRHGAHMDAQSVRDEVLKTVACKAAIKAGWQTEPEELLRLADAVCAGEVKYCPHGRPVAVTLTRRELDKLFKRIV